MADAQNKTRTISLNKKQGEQLVQIAVVSASHYWYLSKFNWHVAKGYAVRAAKWEGRWRTISMHREVLILAGVQIEGLHVDHIDHNKLNNIPSNLRPCTRYTNQANMAMRKNNTSGYKGVVWNNRTSSWSAAIRVRRKRIFLGLFQDIELAAMAYDKAALDHFGEFALTNAMIREGGGDLQSVG